jgi:SAM-dependent methyltransferase
MTACTPEIKQCKGKLILDIGPGPGEWLEICREFGHRIIGIDARITDCEMGSEYIKLSALMRDRQKLNIFYVGLIDYLNQKQTAPYPTPPKIDDNSVFYINMQGSIEQCFKDYMSGPPHRETKKASGLTWVVDKKLKDIFYKMFAEFERILENGGYIYIWANGSTDNAAYNKLVLDTLDKFPSLELYSNESNRQHKVKKVL